MEKEFVPYEQALDLKELGFDKSCYAYFSNKYICPDTLIKPIQIIAEDISESSLIRKLEITCVSPTFSQAFRWFREKYNIIPNIHSVYIDETHTKINFWVWFANYEENSNEEIYYGTYEEAELECLKKLIEIVKNK